MPPSRATITISSLRKQHWTTNHASLRRKSYILDHLRPTATGLDGIQAWFLRLGAPVFAAAPLAQLGLLMLGVVLNEQLTAADHVSHLLTSCSRLLYALRVLRHHRITAESGRLQLYSNGFSLPQQQTERDWMRFCADVRD